MRKFATYRVELDRNKHPVLLKEKEYDYTVGILDSPGIIAELLQEVYRLKFLAEENLYMIALDSKCQILGIFRVCSGGMNSAYVDMKSILMRALLTGATGFVLAHNHPSGLTEPSYEDLQCIKKVKKAGDLIDIKLLDFLIVGDESYYSAKENETL